ncbi:MAG: hypothetical protein AABX13_02145 [Nanoarchaeota archaeon]
MSFPQLWEPLVRPPEPIPFSELEIIVAEGDSFNVGLRRPELYREILTYWNKSQIEQTVVRARDLATALLQQDEAKIARMQSQIGGVQPMWSLSRAVLEGNKLYLALNSVDFMDYTGTNVQASCDPEFRARLMQAGTEDYGDPNRYFANPLAINVAIYGSNSGFNSGAKSGEKSFRQASDLYVVIGKRSDKVNFYPNVYHVIGGYVKNGADGKKIDLAGNLCRELQEEIGLKEEQVGKLLFQGIIRQIPSRVPEVICSLPVYASQEGVERSWREKAPAKFEHRNLHFYPLSKIPTFLEEHSRSMIAPSGQASLMYLLAMFGIKDSAVPLESAARVG